MNKRINTAYHEAGHAVLAHVTGVYEIDGAIDTFGPDVANTPLKRDGLRCAIRAKDYPGLKTDDCDYETAIIAAAGSQAERLYQVKNGFAVDENALFLGAHGDIQLVQSLLGSGRWYEVCAAASYYLGQPDIWKVVERLARAILQAQKPLPADRVTDILEIACNEFCVISVQLLKPCSAEILAEGP